jgi:hypothetical protein
MATFLKYSLSFLFLVIAFANTAQTAFFKSYGGDGNDYGENIIYCLDSGFIAIGGTESYGNGLMDLYLIKTDSIGNVEWHKTFGGPNIDFGKSIVQTSDSGFIACGYSNSWNMNYDILIIKVDKNGNHEWTKNYGGDDWDFGHCIIESNTNPNELFIVGQTYSYGEGDGDAFLFKINQQGDSLSMKTFGGSQKDSYSSLIEDHTGNIYCVGAHTVNNEEKLWISKINANMDTIWNYHSDTTSSTGKSITKIGNKLIYCGNHTPEINNPASLVYFFGGGIDTNGQHQFQIDYGHHTEYDEACIKVIAKPNSNDYYLISNYFNNGDNNIFYAELNNQYQISGTSKIKGNGNDYVHGADTITNKNGFVVIGNTEETTNGFTDIFISKTSNGNWDNNFSNNLLLNISKPKKPKLSIYPNPSSQIIFFKENIPFKNMTLIDEQGRIVDQFVTNNNSYTISHLKAGKYWLSFMNNYGERELITFIKL